ncbi:MAG TPA: DUF2142 domain-containing protein [Anaerolineae bacterium]|nr:DUF2142 domain-containing protein [Anaerolineae bacterium]
MNTRLSRGLLWGLVLGLAMLLGARWLQTTPPWGAPDEPGHFLYVELFAELGRPPQPADVIPAHRRRILTSMAVHAWQAYVHPQAPPTPLEQDPILLASGSQIGQKPPGYYALAAYWLRLLPRWQERPLAAQLRWLRWLSLALHLLTSGVAMFLATRLWPATPHRALGIGMLVGLLPMVGFIGTSVNNDALTMFWGAVGFTGLALARSKKAWGFTLLWIGIGPWLLDLGLLFLWPLATMKGAWTGLRNRWGFSSHRRSIAILVASLSLLSILVLLLPNPRWAAGWRRHNLHRSRDQGQLYLEAAKTPARLSQTLSGLIIVRRQGQPLALEVEVSGEGEALTLLVREDGGRTETQCPLTTTPRICRISHTLSSQAHFVSVQLILPAGHAHVRVKLRDAAGWSLLLNGHGAYPAPIGDPLFTWLEKRLPLPAGYFSRVLYGQVWDVPSLIRYAAYGGFTWASFWGWFGWLTQPYPWWVYGGLAGATLLAVIGLWQKVMVRNRDKMGEVLWLAAAAAVFISIQVFAPMLGQAWQPQGRYLFPALVPITLLLFLGWETWVPEQRRNWLLVCLLLGLITLNFLAWRG